MRKYIYALLAILSLSTQSCVNDEKDIFPVSASQRIADAQLKCAKILTDATTGWILSYYPNTQKAGGTQFFITFSKDNKATVSMARADAANIPPQVSLYHIKSDAGPVLSFDTYNQFIHKFSEPTSDGVGYDGDYEFVILEASADLITLKGKKSGVVMYMHKNDSSESWADYVAKVVDIESNLATPKLSLNIEGEDIIATVNTERSFSFDYTDNNVKTEYSVPYVITNKGIELFEPLKIKGKTITAFDWNSQEKVLRCTDSGVNASLKELIVPLNEYFSKSTSLWVIDPTNMSADVKALYNKAVEGSISVGEQLKYMLFTFDIAANKVLLKFNSSGYGGSYGMAVVLTENTTDQLTIKFDATAAGNGAWYYKNAGYSSFVRLFSGQKFVMTSDNVKSPNLIKFTNSTNPDSWFQVFLAK